MSLPAEALRPDRLRRSRSGETKSPEDVSLVLEWLTSFGAYLRSDSFTGRPRSADRSAA
jgi:hypothetical protein